MLTVQDIAKHIDSVKEEETNSKFWNYCRLDYIKRFIYTFAETKEREKLLTQFDLRGGKK